MKIAPLVVVLLALMPACSKKQTGFAVAHRYAFTGVVVSLNAQDQTASIDGAAVPGFMGAMTMDYPIKSKSEFDRLRSGEKIKATLNTNASNDEYNLTDVKDQGSVK